MRSRDFAALAAGTGVAHAVLSGGVKPRWTFTAPWAKMARCAPAFPI